jgi:prepilin-type N-terminal cleavage/methylation domain-containing protein
MTNQRGFSLIELLIVLAILAVVMVIGYASLRPLMLDSRVRSAAAEVATSLQRARSFAQRQNVDATWELVNANTYRLVLDTRVVEHTLPEGLTFTAPSPGTQITYTAPYGERASAAVKVVVSGYGRQSEIRVVGVTGKVIRSKVEDVP